MIKILFITQNDDFYGATRSLYSLLEGLQGYDIQPFVITPKEDGFTKALSKLGIPYKIISIPWWMAQESLTLSEKRKRLKRIYNSFYTIRQIAREWDIDIIYTNSSVIPEGRMVALYLGLPHIWHIREFGDLDFSLKYIFPKAVSKMILRSSNAVICNGLEVRNHHFKIITKNIHMVYNGSANEEQFASRLSKRMETRDSDEFTFAMLSRLIPSKGQDIAIHGIGELKKSGYKAKLLIAGSGFGSYENELKKLVLDLDLTDQVVFLGSIDDPFRIYYSSNCILICSESEALSRVGLEAMSTGLPCIGKCSGGTPEIIKHGITGFLYDSFENLVSYMEKLAKDPELARKIGLEGWSFAKDNFSIEQYSKNVYKVIESVVS